jgi:hypothetical protein
MVPVGEISGDTPGNFTLVTPRNPQVGDKHGEKVTPVLFARQRHFVSTPKPTINIVNPIARGQFWLSTGHELVRRCSGATR